MLQSMASQRVGHDSTTTERATDQPTVTQHSEQATLKEPDPERWNSRFRPAGDNTGQRVQTLGEYCNIHGNYFNPDLKSLFFVVVEGEKKSTISHFLYL